MFAGHAGGWGPGDTLWFAYILKLLIMLFPVINMVSVYPLISVTLGENLLAILPRMWRRTLLLGQLTDTESSFQAQAMGTTVVVQVAKEWLTFDCVHTTHHSGGVLW